MTPTIEAAPLRESGSVGLTGITGMDRLPPEVFTTILSYFELKELRAPFVVCTSWGWFISDYIWRTFEIPISALLGILAPLKATREKGIIVHLLDTVYSKIDKGRWARCLDRARIVKRLLIDCNVHSSSAGLLRRLLSGNPLCPAAVHLHFSSKLEQPPRKHAEIYALLVNPMLRTVDYHSGCWPVPYVSSEMRDTRADCLVKKLVASCPWIETFKYQTLHHTDCALVAHISSLRFLFLHCGISLSTWALLSRQCPLLEQIEVENPYTWPPFQENDIGLEMAASRSISFPSLHTLKLMGPDANATLPLMLLHLVLPSLRTLSFRLAGLAEVASPSIFECIPERAPDLEMLHITYDGVPLQGWMSLGGLRRLSNLSIKSYTPGFGMTEVDIKVLLENFPQLQRLSLTCMTWNGGLNGGGEPGLSFNFLCHIPDCCPALRSLDLTTKISESDDYDRAASGIIFKSLEKLSLEATGTTWEKYEAFVATLARICPRVKVVNIYPKRILVPASPSYNPYIDSPPDFPDAGPLFFAHQARDGDERDAQSGA